MWPEWAIFESSWQQVIFSKVVQTFGNFKAILKNVLSMNYCGYYLCFIRKNRDILYSSIWSHWPQVIHHNLALISSAIINDKKGFVALVPGELLVEGVRRCLTIAAVEPLDLKKFKRFLNKLASTTTNQHAPKRQFFLKNEVFQNNPKSCQILGLLL